MPSTKLHTFDGKLMSASEIAALTGASRDTVDRYLKEGVTGIASFRALAKTKRANMYDGTRRGGKRSAYSSKMPGEFKR